MATRRASILVEFITQLTATLARYALKFEERATRYSRAWHLCVKADDRCRSEFWPAERRRQLRFHEAHPQMSALDAEKPWNTVIRESTDNLEYWLQELQEPAMIYSSLRADTAPSYALQQHEQTQNKGGGKRGSNNGGKGGHPRCNRGVYSTKCAAREGPIRQNPCKGQAHCLQRMLVQ